MGRGLPRTPKVGKVVRGAGRAGRYRGFKAGKASPGHRSGAFGWLAGSRKDRRARGGSE